MFTVFKIIILPVCVGVLINYIYGARIAIMKRILPTLSILAIYMLIAIIVASNQQNIHSIAVIVIIAVVLHNLAGFLSGYLISYWLGYDKDIRKTLAIEVGMQNSGLAVALATEYFKPLAALPGAIFSIWHNLAGSLLAVIWSRQANRK